MRYMLDTNICIQIMNHASNKMLAKLLEHEGQLCISTIAAAELRFGAAKSAARKKNHQQLAEFLSPLEVMGVEKLSERGVLIRARIQTIPSQQYGIGRELNRLVEVRWAAEGIGFPRGVVPL